VEDEGLSGRSRAGLAAGAGRTLLGITGRCLGRGQKDEESGPGEQHHDGRGADDDEKLRYALLAGRTLFNVCVNGHANLPDTRLPGRFRHALQLRLRWLTIGYNEPRSGKICRAAFAAYARTGAVRPAPSKRQLFDFIQVPALAWFLQCKWRGRGL